MAYITPLTIPVNLSWAWENVPADSGKAYYLQLIGTNTSAEDPWVVPEGHCVIGREGSYLIVRIDKEEPDGLEDGPRPSSEGTQ